MMSYSQPQKVPSQENQTLFEIQHQLKQLSKLTQQEELPEQEENQELTYELQQLEQQQGLPAYEEEEGESTKKIPGVLTYDDDVPSLEDVQKIVNQSLPGPPLQLLESIIDQTPLNPQDGNQTSENPQAQATINALSPIVVAPKPPSTEPVPDDGGICDPVTRIDPEWAPVYGGNYTYVVAEGEITSSKITVTHHDWPFSHDSHDNNFHVDLDPSYSGLASTAHPLQDNGKYNVQMEWEIGSENFGDTDRFPNAFWPWVWDRVWMEGRWVYDCAHFNFHPGPPPHGTGYRTELHPSSAVAFTRNEPAIFPGENNKWSSAAVTYIYIHGEGGYHNTPVGGRNYEFDIPMPPKPSTLPTLQLRYNIIGLPFGGPAPILTAKLQENKAHVVVPLSGIPASTALKYGAIVAAKWFDPSGPPPTEEFRTLRVTFDSIKINEDHDWGSGEWKNLWVGVNGKWIELSGPSGHYGLNDVDDVEVKRFPTGSKNVTVTVPENGELRIKTTGWESDNDSYFGHGYLWYLALPFYSPFGPDKLGALNDNDKIGFMQAIYNATDNFGIGPQNETSIRDGPSDTNEDFTLNYRIEQLSTGNLSVLSPPAEQSESQFSVTPDNKLKINMTFNKPVDTSTVIPRSSLVLNTEGNPNANVVLTWSNNNTFLTLVSVDDFLGHGALCDPFGCFFRLNLDGTGSGVIRATDGSLLNGGIKDYWTGFTLIG